MNIDYILSERLSQIDDKKIYTLTELYDSSVNPKLSKIFAIVHTKLNELISFMFAKQSSPGKHYNADESRYLINYINFISEMQFELKNSEYSFIIDSSYKDFLVFCLDFLVTSGGSSIPDDLPKLELKKYETIFELNLTIQIDPQVERSQLKLIGEGSYAKVFRFKNEFLDTFFVLKRAKQDLDEKELARFAREFEVLKSINSPYIIKVYSYDKLSNEYIMEMADLTINKFIQKNPNLPALERFRLVRQILQGVNDLHKKHHFHRDISIDNILIFQFDNVNIAKLSDFGLVKTPESTLTDVYTDFKGSLNDPSLRLQGFSNYDFSHEIYALTLLIFFVMTGRTNLSNISSQKHQDFINRGTNIDKDKRYENLNELLKASEKAFL